MASGTRLTTRKGLSLFLLLLGLAALAVAIIERLDRRGEQPSHAAVRLFSPSSFWNAPLAPDAPLDHNSAALSDQLHNMALQEESAGIGPWIQTNSYTTTIYKVPADQPTERVELSDGTLAWRQSLQAAFDTVPIPPGARVSAGTDAQTTIWQPATDKLWELFQASKDAQGNWHANFGGAIKDVSQSPGYYTRDSWPGAASWWGANATSLPMIGGTIRLDELRQGHIDHALAMDIPAARSGVFSWPAQRTDGFGGPDAIPEGARFRLDPNLEIARLHLPRLVRMIAEAAQRHGMVVRDQTGSGNAIGFYVEDTTIDGPSADPFWAGGRPRPDGYLNGRWPNALMAKFPWRHLELLKMRLCSTGPCPPPKVLPTPAPSSG